MISPPQENYEALSHRTEITKRENALFIEYAKRKNTELFPQAAVPENATRLRHNLKRRGKLFQFPTNRKLAMANHVLGQIDNAIKQEAFAKRRSTKRLQFSIARSWRTEGRAVGPHHW
jgi:hypothetical protein